MIDGIYTSHITLEQELIKSVGPLWPRQSLFHGCVIGVEWKGGGGQYADDDTLLDPGDIDVGIGHTQSEALAAVMSTQYQNNFLQGLSDIEKDRIRHVLEEQLVGFSQGLLGELDNPDGYYRFLQEVHRYTFDDEPGGQLYDFVPLEHDSSDSLGDNERLSPIVCLDCDTYQDATMDLSDSNAACSNCSSQNVAKSRIPKVAIYASPRYYEPKDPCIILTNTLRSTRHGGDGDYEDDGTMKCRISGQYFEHWDSVIHLYGIIQVPGVSNPSSSSSIPQDCYTLLGESVRLDGSRYYATDMSQYGNSAAASVELVLENYKIETKITYGEKKVPPDNTWFTDVSFSGVAPSPVACNTWSQAWIPLFLDYRLEYWPDKHLLGNSNWKMGDPDFEYDGNVPNLQTQQSIIIEGRTPLATSTGNVIAAQIQRMLEEEDSLEEAESLDIWCPNCELMTGEMVNPPLRVPDSLGETIQVQCQGEDEDEVICNTILTPDDGVLGILDEETESQLEQLEQDYRDADLLTAVLSEINDKIRSNLPEDVLRAGVMELKHLNIIDAFGQILELDVMNSSSGQEPSIALSMEARTVGGELTQFLMKPRIPDGARLQFRLLSSSDDLSEAHAGTSDMSVADEATPLCAFLLPDHIEWAMEVFDSDGEARGQLRVAERDWLLGGIQKGRLEWDPAPGSEVGIGQLPNSGNQHVDSLLNKLVEMSIQDEVDDNSEGVLSAILRAIDTTYWDMDPFGQGGDDIPAMFMGRPVAIIRARLCLEIDVPNVNEPEYSDYVTHFEKLNQTNFEVRLGSLDKITDGLLGYFVNDDYSRFNAVYPTAGGIPITPHIETPCPDHPDGWEPTCSNCETEALNHQFMVFDPTIELKPNQEVMLTLIMNPQATIHATSCLLPQKEIGMVRTHYEKAMNKIAPTFKVGPVLVDPENVRMPIPDRQGLIWSWNFKESYTEWKETPITDADHLAGLPKGKSAAFDGWIKLDIDESQDN